MSEWSDCTHWHWLGFYLNVGQNVANANECVSIHYVINRTIGCTQHGRSLRDITGAIVKLSVAVPAVAISAAPDACLTLRLSAGGAHVHIHFCYGQFMQIDLLLKPTSSGHWRSCKFWHSIGLIFEGLPLCALFRALFMERLLSSQVGTKRAQQDNMMIVTKWVPNRPQTM